LRRIGTAVQQETRDRDVALTRGQMQWRVPLGVRLIQLGTPMDMTLDLIQITDRNGAMEIQGRSRRLATGEE
jgi:hypothetical protein